MGMKVSQRKKTVSHLNKQRVLNNRFTVRETDIYYSHFTYTEHFF